MNETISHMRCGICRKSQFNRIMGNCTFSVDIVQCFNCGFIQTEPVSAAALSHYYSTCYREKWTEQTINSMREQSCHQAEAQVAFLEKILEPKHFGIALDYGAADGELLRMLRSKCKSLYATEQDPLYAKGLTDKTCKHYLMRKTSAMDDIEGRLTLSLSPTS